MNSTEGARRHKQLERLAWLMDNSIPIPGTTMKVGLDPIIGLIPWIGDALGAVISGYIISEAGRLGAPKTVVMKMAFNVLLDALIGIVPGVGDLFDLGWKANQRNVKLLEQYMEAPRRAVASSRLFVLCLGLVLMIIVILTGLAGYWLIVSLWQAIRNG